MRQVSEDHFYQNFIVIFLIDQWRMFIFAIRFSYMDCKTVNSFYSSFTRYAWSVCEEHVQKHSFFYVSLIEYLHLLFHEQWTYYIVADECTEIIPIHFMTEYVRMMKYNKTADNRKGQMCKIKLWRNVFLWRLRRKSLTHQWCTQILVSLVCTKLITKVSTQTGKEVLRERENYPISIKIIAKDGTEMEWSLIAQRITARYCANLITTAATNQI